MSASKQQSKEAKESGEGSHGGGMQRIARKRFSDLELATLDTMFALSKGKPDKSVLERTAKALKLDEKQVSVLSFLRNM